MKILAPTPLAQLAPGSTVQVVFDQETHEYTWGPLETASEFRGRVKAGIKAFKDSLAAPAPTSTEPVDITADL